MAKWLIVWKFSEIQIENDNNKVCKRYELMAQLIHDANRCMDDIFRFLIFSDNNRHIICIIWIYKIGVLNFQTSYLF